MAKKKHNCLPKWIFGKNTVPYDLINLSSDYRVNVIASAKLSCKTEENQRFTRNDLKRYVICSNEHLSRLWKTVIKSKAKEKISGRHYHIDLTKAKGLKPNQFKLLDYLCRECNIGLKGSMNTTIRQLAKQLNVTWQSIQNELNHLQKQGLISFSKDKRKFMKGYYNIVICESVQTKQPVIKQHKNTKKKETTNIIKKQEEYHQTEEERQVCLKMFEDIIAKL